MGATGLGALLLGGCGDQQPKPASNPQPLLTGAPDSLGQTPVKTDRKLSAARYREVDLVIMRPADSPAGPLPVCVALHGSGGVAGPGAKMFLDLDAPALLTEVARATKSPFALVAVDGGNWIGNKDDDPQRMLNDDLPGWLDYYDLAPTPFAVLGISEGGYGALDNARMPGFAAVAAISPRLHPTWSEASEANEFVNQAQWERTEPLRHVTEYANLPVGLWCGTGDPFLPAVRQFGEKVGAAKTEYGPGGHDVEFWRKSLPGALAFVGDHL